MAVCRICAELSVALYQWGSVAPEKLRVWRGPGWGVPAHLCGARLLWWCECRSGTQAGDPGPVCKQHLRLHHRHVRLLLRYPPTHPPNSSLFLRYVIIPRNKLNQNHHRNGINIFSYDDDWRKKPKLLVASLGWAITNLGGWFQNPNKIYGWSVSFCM